MSLPTPNFVTTEDIQYATGGWEFKVLGAGTFVRPLDLRYVPQHITDDRRWDYYNEDANCFCYTPVGIILVPLDKMRKI